MSFNIDRILATNPTNTLHINYLKSLRAVDDPTQKLYKAYLVLKKDHPEPTSEYYVRPNLLLKYEKLKNKSGELAAFRTLVEASKIDDLAECQIFGLTRPARFDGEPSRYFRPIQHRFSSEVNSPPVTREFFEERRLRYLDSIMVGMPNDSSNCYFEEYAKLKKLYPHYITPFQKSHESKMDMTSPNPFDFDEKVLQADFEILELDYFNLREDAKSPTGVDNTDLLDEAFDKLVEFCDQHPDYLPLLPRKHIPKIVILPSQSMIHLLRKGVQSLSPVTRFSKINLDIGPDDD
jgi:hypothetical protein